MWYAHRTLSSSSERTLNAAIQASDVASVWLNNQLVWESDPQHAIGDQYILPLQLKAGNNEILIRCGKKHVTYFPPKPDSQSGFQFWIGDVQAPLAATTEPNKNDQRNKDQSTNTSNKISSTDSTIVGWRADGARQDLDARPPMAWDLSVGTNVSWRHELAQAGQPVHYHNKLFIASRHRQIQAYDLTTGEQLWQHIDPAGSSDYGRPRGVPIVDASGVWVRWNDSSVSHYSHDGSLQWHHEHAAPGSLPDQHGQLSPIKIDQHIYFAQRMKVAKGAPGEVRIIAVDAHTGAEAWHHQGVGDYLGLAAVHPSSPSSPSTNQTPSAAILLSSNGYVFEATSGQLAGQDVWPVSSAGHEQPVPLIHQGIAYWTTIRGQSATEFIAKKTVRLAGNDFGTAAEMPAVEIKGSLFRLTC